MKYLDFMPEEKIGLDTVIMHAFTELTEDINENWLTQSTNDIYAFCKCANSFYSAIAEYFAEEVYKDDLPDVDRFSQNGVSFNYDSDNIADNEPYDDGFRVYHPGHSAFIRVKSHNVCRHRMLFIGQR